MLHHTLACYDSFVVRYLQEFGVSGVLCTCIFLNWLQFGRVQTNSIWTWRGVLFLFLYVVSLLCDLVLALSSVRHLSRNYFRQVKSQRFLLYLISTTEAFSEPKMQRWGNFGRLLMWINKELNGVHAVLHFTPYYARLSTPHQHFAGYTSVISP